uniref:Neur_chan_LBD domain-containing protein n=1 Tax=Macrostomum lignano TaxID=282301 RepID=A0A1I8FGY5_9PLAT
VNKIVVAVNANTHILGRTYRPRYELAEEPARQLITWVDYHFKWDPAEYGQVTKINIDPKRVWKPDILLYNSADEKFDATYPTNVVIDHTGLMTYVPPGMFRSTCKIDITWFPFDTQVCKLKFGSWTYDGGTVDLRFQVQQ